MSPYQCDCVRLQAAFATLDRSRGAGARAHRTGQGGTRETATNFQQSLPRLTPSQPGDVIGTNREGGAASLAARAAASSPARVQEDGKRVDLAGTASDDLTFPGGVYPARCRVGHKSIFCAINTAILGDWGMAVRREEACDRFSRSARLRPC